MPYTYKDLRNNQQWKATAGLSEKDFITLSEAFGKAYELMHGVSLEQAATNLKQDFVLPTYKDCLFFVLFQLKNGPPKAELSGASVRHGWFLRLAQFP